MLSKIKLSFINRSPLLLAFLFLVPFICVFPLLNDKKSIIKYIINFCFILIIGTIVGHLQTGISNQLILVVLAIYNMIVLYKIAKAAPLNEKRHKFSNWKTSVFLGVILFVLINFIKPYTFHLANIPSQNMLPTLKVGDTIYFDKLSFSLGENPNRGDIVIFRKPKDTESLYIGRIIGLPFEKITTEGNKVFIDSKEATLDFKKEQLHFLDAKAKIYSETYFDKINFQISLLVDNRYTPEKKEIALKEGEYFILGDNRNNSMDSRFYGAVPRSSVLGKAKFVYFNPKSMELKIKTIQSLDTSN